MNKRLIITLTIVTLSVGVIYSTSNILNSYYSYRNAEFNFLPIGSWDELFYYSNVRELLDGNIFSGDSQIKEYKSKLTISKSFGLSYFFTGISSWITGDVISGFYINRFIFPIINFIIFFFLLRYFTRNFLFSILCSLLIIFFYDYFTLSFPYFNIEKINLIVQKHFAFKSLTYGFYRIPNIAFTNIVSLFTIGLFYKFIKNINIKYFLLLGLIFVISAYTYIVTFVISGCFYLIALIYLNRNRPARVGLLKFSIITVFITISPIVYIFINTIINEPEYYSQLNETMVGFYGGNIRGNLYDILRNHAIFNLFGILILHMFDTSPHRKINTLFFLSIITIMSICLIIFGANYYERFILRGILPIFLPIMFSTFYHIIKILLIEKLLVIKFNNKQLISISFRPKKFLNKIIFKLDSIFKYNYLFFGILFIFLGMIFNEKTISLLFTNDGSIDILSYRIFILFCELSCILFGIFIIYYQNESINQFRNARLFINYLIFNIIHIKYLKNIMVIFFIIFTLFTAIIYNIQTTNATRDKWYSDRRDLNKLFKKLNYTTKKNYVIMTIDPEIQYRIPTYTHLNLYNPNILITGFMGRKERISRLYDALSFYKIDPFAFKFLLENRYESSYGYTKDIPYKSLYYFPFQFWMSNYYWYPEIHNNINFIVKIELDSYKKHNYDRDRLINNIDYFLTSSFTSNIYRDFSTLNMIDYSMYEILFTYKEFTVYKAI